MSYSTEDNHEFDLLVKQDKLQLLYSQSFPSTYFSLFTAFIYAGIIWGKIDSTYIYGWLTAVVIATLIRLTLFFTYKKQNPQGAAILKWEKPYFASLMLAVAIWSIGIVMIAYRLPFLYQVISFLIMLGMAGAALTVYSAIRYFSSLAVLGVLTPVIILFVYIGNRTSLLIALTGLIFLVSALRATRILSHNLHYSYMLTHALSRAKEEAERLASIDMLTGLNNRRAFTEQANVQVEYCKRYEHPVAALVLDADHFKKINDSRGHAAGDIALQNLARTLQKITRSSDIIGRIGGEEFAVLLSNTEEKEALLVAEKLRKWIADHPVNINDDYFSITVSIGVATDHDYNLEKLLNRADEAMYQAKQSGRNRVMLAKK